MFRFRNRIKSLIALPAMAGVLLLTACQASGGGTLPSVGTDCRGYGNATFGFTASDTTAAPTPDAAGTFQGTYIDRCAGVMLRGTGGLRPVAPPADAPPGFSVCVLATADYQSTNPQQPGSGTMTVLACDLAAQPKKDGSEFVAISVDTGPFAPYVNAGLTAGNI